MFSRLFFLGCVMLLSWNVQAQFPCFSGQIAVSEGYSVDFCNGESDSFEVKFQSKPGGIPYAYVVVNGADEIVHIDYGNTIDLEGLGNNLRVYSFSLIGAITAEVGDNINTTLASGCYALSANYIEINNSGDQEGGTLVGGPFSFCVGDDIADHIDAGAITLSDNSGANSQWVVTFPDGSIAGLPPSYDVVNFDGAGEGVCSVWHLSYADGITGLEAGAQLSDLGGCYSLSNPIEVNRSQPEGGQIAALTNVYSHRVVVANRVSETISVIDGATNTVIDNYDMPDNGEPMYVVHNSYNNSVLVGDYNGKVIAFDGADFSVMGSATAGNGVFHMWISPDNKQLWVNNELDRTISVINPNTLENIATVQLPQDLYDAGFKPHDVIISPDNQSAFVTLLGNQTEDYVIKYSTSTFVETARVGVGQDPHVSLTSENDKLYVASQLSGELKVLNRSDLSEVATLNIPNAHGLGMNPAGTYLYVSNISNGGAEATYTVDLATNTLVGDPVDAPFAVPHNYAVSSDNNQLFLTHSGGNNYYVSIYSLGPTPTLETTVEVHANPFGLAAYSYEETTTEMAICAGDGDSDAFDVMAHGASGNNIGWVITDTDLNILGLPMAPPFDLEGAGAGTCLIWRIAYNDGLTGLEVEQNVGDLEGCYALSNSITVNRNNPVGGTLEGGSFSFCVGDGVADHIDAGAITLSGNSGMNSQWVVTFPDGSIAGLPPSYDVVDFDGAGEGVCSVWHLSYEDGLMGLEAGEQLADISGCYSLSNPIEVNRSQPVGGTLEGGPFSFCVGDDVADHIDAGAITLSGNSDMNNQWVVTFPDGSIAGLPPSYDVVDFDGAGEGVCSVWHLSYANGLTGLEAGAQLAEISGCYSLSNPVLVERTVVNGGTVSTVDGENEVTVTVGDGVDDILEFISMDAMGENFTYVVTDDANNILGIPPGNSQNFDGAPAGVCRVWGLSYDGALLVDQGDNIDQVQLSEGCSSLSGNFITVNRTTNFNDPNPQQNLNPVFNSENLLDVQVYPNPVAVELQVVLNTAQENGQINLDIIQLDGKVVYSSQLDADQGRVGIHVANLPSGTYFLRVNDGKQVVTKRFVKAQ